MKASTFNKDADPLRFVHIGARCQLSNLNALNEMGKVVKTKREKLG